jgi:hypothetical protein
MRPLRLALVDEVALSRGPRRMWLQQELQGEEHAVEDVKAKLDRPALHVLAIDGFAVDIVGASACTEASSDPPDPASPVSHCWCAGRNQFRQPSCRSASSLSAPTFPTLRSAAASALAECRTGARAARGKSRKCVKAQLAALGALLCAAWLSTSASGSATQSSEWKLRAPSPGFLRGAAE